MKTINRDDSTWNVPLLFDGGMGTYYSEICHKAGSGCELANLSNPQLISQIHKEYIENGAKAIKTNTFGANLHAFQGDEELLEQVITAGYQIACDAAGDDALVFADIGPIDEVDGEEPFSSYQIIVDQFLKCKARYFLFETNSTSRGLRETASYIRKKSEDAFILVSYAALPDGYTREGIPVRELLQEAATWKEIDGIGLNCVIGARHMAELLSQLTVDIKELGDKYHKVFSVMPNAGYPIVIHNRTYYEGDPVYFAEQMQEIQKLGVKILGGCCGTKPIHIRKTAEILATPIPAQVSITAAGVSNENIVAESGTNQFWEKLQRGEKVIAVELDPPRKADHSGFMEGAKRLQNAGIDILTIADCPIGRPRMDSSLLACKVTRELQLQVIPHMTCRDRNLNATKALLLGLYAEGVRNLLTVTGDPIPTAERDEVKSVYQFNSRKMSRYIHTLGESELPTPFQVFGALNLNARNFQVQLNIAKDKEANGMCGFLTQPVLSKEGLENLILARKELKGKILGGIMPVLSEKNARFMNSEINGIHVAPEICDLYIGVNREEGEQLALKISTEIAREIAPYVDGYYIMTPFNRVGLIENIIHKISQ